MGAMDPKQAEELEKSSHPAFKYRKFAGIVGLVYLTLIGFKLI
jgi:hypothetical protein